jgi:hypothetical protein
MATPCKEMRDGLEMIEIRENRELLCPANYGSDSLPPGAVS